MKKRNVFTLKKVALALTLAGYAYGAAWAGTMSTVNTIKGIDSSTLVAPSSNLLGVDFSFVGTQQTDGFITVGDTIKVAYDHGDTDEDADGTTVTWTWYNGATVVGTSTDSTQVAGEFYTLPITAAMAGATRIGAVVTGNSKTGDPRTAITVTVADISLAAAGNNPDGTPLPDVGGGGPIVSATRGAGIFLVSAGAAAGSSAVNYGAAGATAVPKVGEVFEIKVWDDADGDGVWDTGEADLGSTLTAANVTWTLDGMAPTAAADGTGATAVADAGTGLTYTIPVNSGSNSGHAWGDQGYKLKVTW